MDLLFFLFFDFKETDDNTAENYSLDKQGVDLIKLSYYLDNYNIDFVYGDDSSNNIDDFGGGQKQVALRVSTQIKKYDISGILQKYKNLAPGYGASMSSVYGDNIKLYSFFLCTMEIKDRYMKVFLLKYLNIIEREPL